MRNERGLKDAKKRVVVDVHGRIFINMSLCSVTCLYLYPSLSNNFCQK